MKQKKVLPLRPAVVMFFVVCCATLLFSQDASTQAAPTQDAPTQAAPSPQFSSRDAAADHSITAANSFDQVIDRTVEREHFFMTQMKNLHPLVETYLQNLRRDREIDAPIPASDVYFLGRLDMSQGTGDKAFSSPNNEGLG